jgi:uncharacterized membrane protein
MKNNKTLIITTILCLLPIILGISVWDKLPAEIGIHFDSQGNADNFLSKPLAVFGLPVVMALLNFYVHFRMNNDARVENASSFLRSLSKWIIPLISIIAMPVSLFIAMGIDIKVNVIAAIITGTVIIIYGNFLPKSKYNFSIGIRLPWTLNSEDNWNKTNRFAGFVYVIGGLFIVAGGLLSLWYVLIAVIALLLIIPFVYSYLLYRKQQGDKSRSPSI